ncbi:hypothetical protein [Legionella hackeliae]|uniref:Uncharacterized protein n=1 Tax=Legionella hackeliae TaxID=449 RepID=A0A0A8UTB5_LEGHA|nr:hypothetical protein [Legionella hackeliae]KTD10506.1 hypothetical protein Lhac_2874 [Legionella hackeliae]CEK10009.1 exported protein of unknown function [Legionella hackeliae]STX49926.1 Uncharacterised protein [Legionella hackeliae]
MFRLFKASLNTKSIPHAALQVVNLAAFGAATYALLTDPNATIAEFGLDAAVHLISYFGLSDPASLACEVSASSANLIRLGAIYAGVTSGSTSAPDVANMIDTLVHGGNAIASFIKADSEPQAVEVAKKMS